jgi:hypothetical protein
MKDMEFEIIRSEVYAIAEYAKSSRFTPRGKEETEKRIKRQGKVKFYDYLMELILTQEYTQAHNKNFLKYSHIRLKLALSTQDFSCTEFTIWLIYKIFNNPNISERTKSEFKFLHYNNHRFLYYAREDRVFSPIKIFGKDKNLICGMNEYYKYLPGHHFMEDYSFMIPYFQGIISLEKLEMKPYYAMENLQSFETIPMELKNIIVPEHAQHSEITLNKFLEQNRC